MFDTDAGKASADGDTTVAGLSVLGGSVVFEDLTFVVKASRNWKEAVAAIAVRGAAKVVFLRCQFEQDVPGFSAAQQAIASVLVEGVRKGAGEPVPRVEFRQCCFKGKDFAHRGQAAVAVSGPADIRMTDCGFYPHAAALQLRKGCQVADTAVTLDHCSAFVFDGSVFGFEPGGSARLKAKWSLFAGYVDTTSTAFASYPPDLIHQTDSAPIQYTGSGNCYANLNALWNGPDGLLNKLADFSAQLQKRNRGTDDSTRELLPGQGESPWSDDRPFDQKPDNVAFQVRSAFDGFGLQSCYWGKLERPAASEPVLLANQKLYDPDYKGKSPRIYTSLSRAWAASTRTTRCCSSRARTVNRSSCRRPCTAIRYKRRSAPGPRRRRCSSSRLPARAM